MLLIVKERNYLTDSGDRGNKGAGELPVRPRVRPSPVRPDRTITLAVITHW
jgi:hypothetical protein